MREVTIDRDEGIRADTTLEAVAKIRPALPGRCHHRRQRQPVLRRQQRLRASWTRELAERRGLTPLGIFRGFAVAGCEPDEMGIGPVYAVPRLLERTGYKVSDIGLWELNEAFACQVLYCRDQLRSRTSC